MPSKPLSSKPLSSKPLPSKTTQRKPSRPRSARSSPLSHSPQQGTKRAEIQNLLALGVPRNEIVEQCGTTISYVDTVAIGVSRCRNCPPRRCRTCGGLVKTIPCRVCGIRSGELVDDC